MAKRPDPAPLETDDVKIVAALTLAWVGGLVVLLVLKAVGTEVRGWWLVMCADGALLGLLGVKLCRNRRRALENGSARLD